MVIGMFFNNEDKIMNPDEINLINLILEDLNYNSNDFKIEKKSNDYTTLTYKQYDLFRLKVSEYSWISIFIPPAIKKKWIDSPLFADEDKKTHLHWISYINNIYDYKDVLLDSIEFINKQ